MTDENESGRPEAAAAHHAELKSALRDLETGKGSTLAAARIFRSTPQLLDVLPDIPLVQKVRELVRRLNAPQKWDGFEDRFWTLCQTILWLLTRDPWVVDQASNDSGGQGEMAGEIMAATLIDLLNLRREDVQDAAGELRRRCLNGLTAIDGKNCRIPEIEWRHLNIVLHTDNTPYIVRRGQSSTAPDYPDVIFLRDDVLREFPPEEQSAGRAASAPPEVRMVENLPMRIANWTAPTRMEVVGFSPTALSTAPGRSMRRRGRAVRFYALPSRRSLSPQTAMMRGGQRSRTPRHLLAQRNRCLSEEESQGAGRYTTGQRRICSSGRNGNGRVIRTYRITRSKAGGPTAIFGRPSATISDRSTKIKTKCKGLRTLARSGRNSVQRSRNFGKIGRIRRN